MKISISNITQFLGHKNAIYCLAQLNTLEFVSAGADGMLVKWNINHPEEGTLIANAEEPIYSLLVCNHKIIMGLKSGKLFIYDLNQETPGKLIELNEGAIFSLCFSKDFIFAGTGNGSIIRLNRHFELVNQTILAGKAIRSLLFWEDKLIAGATGGFIFTLRENLNLLSKKDSMQDSIFAICSLKKHVVTGGKDATIKLWNHDFIEPSSPILAHLHQVKHLAFNSQNNLLASFSMDKSIRIWDSDSLELVKVISFEKHQTHTSSINCGLWFNENTLISCSDDRKIFAFKLNLNPT